MNVIALNRKTVMKTAPKTYGALTAAIKYMFEGNMAMLLFPLVRWSERSGDERISSKPCGLAELARRNPIPVADITQS